MLKKIAVLGVESTGKTTLCEALAQHFDCFWCPEYARNYLTTKGNDYSMQDMHAMALGQINLENAWTLQSIQHQKPLLFIDTEMYNFKVWHEYVYASCPTFILQHLAQRRYHHYLFTNMDLDWRKDNLRTYEDLQIRKMLHHTYQDILINQSTPWSLISGKGSDRLNNAINAIEQILHQQNN